MGAVSAPQVPLAPDVPHDGARRAGERRRDLPQRVAAGQPSADLFTLFDRQATISGSHMGSAYRCVRCLGLPIKKTPRRSAGSSLSLEPIAEDTFERLER